MPDSPASSTSSRWAQTNDALDAWLQTRQELIVLYCSICGVHQQLGDSKSKIQRLKSFCQVMMDYASAGHFEIYTRLQEDAAANNSAIPDNTDSLLNGIQDTTDIALDFNDRYQVEELTEEMQEKLTHHLSKLGQILVERFDQEDRLIAGLHPTQQPEPA